MKLSVVICMAAIPLAWFRAGWDFASPAGDLLKIAVCDQGNGWVNLTHRVRQQAGSYRGDGAQTGLFPARAGPTNSIARIQWERSTAKLMALKLASSRLKPVLRKHRVHPVGTINRGIDGDQTGLFPAKAGPTKKHRVHPVGTINREIDGAQTGLFPAKAGPTKKHRAHPVGTINRGIDGDQTGLFPAKASPTKASRASSGNDQPRN
uniref:Uncharacterized protein n=1 Tax=Pseudomonas graminis TaxID=158627 RepID=A0A7C2BDC6_9PSED